MFTFGIDDQVRSATAAWARAPHGFSVSVETFARWLQVNPADRPRFPRHQVLADSESLDAVYLSFHAAVRWCRHVLRRDPDNRMADFVLLHLNRKLMVSPSTMALLDTVFDGVADMTSRPCDSDDRVDNVRIAARALTMALGELYDAESVEGRRAILQTLVDHPIGTAADDASNDGP